MPAARKLQPALPPMRLIQEKALKEIRADLKFKNLAVLAICPGGGKTIASLYEVADLIAVGKRVLILAHGTNVLKNQWTEELKRFFIPYGTSIDSKSQVVVTIPQAIVRNIPESLNFDLVIVDEAHEFYYAQTVQKILNKLKTGAKQLLLTGTPSVFIKAGITPVVISAVEAFDEGLLSDTYFGLIKGSYKIKDSDYNDEKDVKSTFTESRKDLFSSMEETLGAILKRVSKKDLNGYQPQLLEKTMLAARNIKQARFMEEFLKEKGIHCILSTSDNDKDSLAITSFKNDPNISVLIVVRRGILGFNMPELINVVDFTASRNINRIYQLYARVLRVHPQGKQKNFFKVCNALNPAIDALYMKAALCLCNADFIRNFNGKNLSGQTIPIPKKHFDRISSNCNSNKDSDVTFEELIESEVLEEVKNAIFLKKSRRYETDKIEYQYAKFGEVMQVLKGKNFSCQTVFDGSLTKSRKEILLEMAKSGVARPNRNNKDPDISALGKALYKLTSPSQEQFDLVFFEKIKELAPLWFVRDGGKREILIRLAKAGKPRPSSRSRDRIEKALAQALIGYTSASKNHDAQFNALIRKIAPHWFIKEPQQRTRLESGILRFAKSNPKRRPSRISIDLKEKRFDRFIIRLLRKERETGITAPILAKLREIAPNWFKNSATNDIEPQRFPSRRNSNIKVDEKSLSIALIELARNPNSKMPRLSETNPYERALWVHLRAVLRKREKYKDVVEEIMAHKPNWVEQKRQ